MSEPSRASIERVSTHLLDTGAGRPAAGVEVSLEQLRPDGTATAVGGGVTDADGRVAQLNAEPLEPGEYRLVFVTADYFRAVHGAMFYPRIAVSVLLPATRAHFHIPVLASTYSYSTYLGS
ncbi:5-hydroxyisourate hydrolase [Nakamurella panacisegetis]|uniref:5-hydroxyisourate hydrolase n=1 Tax=Nakamurella panacisegetis TaxID=1090615 RepID=A0A1H0K5U5_9ACTN|nr:hydroxyisourate hydrolase [Nakamurella panacisegetis]SDO51153.1 5-hydroxyisourate hydrolase [Nakamurella panacisegetis]